ncbi:TauD/TfdA family dioxygenase [Burkholderia ambifaria]|uniref:TauD/TfdA family dioxygenase n=1 Tax=Burkholderia ambifaria TaxID=152480 RepID=UPI00158D0F5B|nr:TauD/TfdA family dioxygenase [Burkholderia ambifaria]
MNNIDSCRLLHTSTDELTFETEAEGIRCVVAAHTLRHACVCDQCIDSHSGQRRTHVGSWPSDVEIARAEIQNGTELKVVFKNDGHHAVVRISDLVGETLTSRETDHRRLWDESLTTEPVSISWLNLTDPSGHFSLLERLVCYGFAIVNECPETPGFIMQLARYIGRIKESRVGPIFDVKFDPSPSNLAFTADDLFLHTDNPYRDPVPGWQILHCIRNAAQGGESYVADGFASAAYLRDHYPEDYEALTRTIVRFKFESRDASFMSWRPVIALSEQGEPLQVSFNDRSMLPVVGPATRVARFYRAYQRYRSLLADPARQVRFKLAPGQTFIVDNHRVLHARAAFSSTSPRHLQGAYVDSDWVLSNFRVARNTLTGRGYAA